MSASRAWLRIARRELAGGLGGFWIYLACLALGAWAIAAAGSITASFGAGLELQSRMLLGGDAGITISQREATEEERAWMAERGTAISEAAGADMMGHFGDAVKAIDVRSIDAPFPLIGAFVFNDGAPPLPEILAKKGDTWGAAVSDSLLKQLQMKLGDVFSLGDLKVEARALLKREPDRIGDPGAFEPRAIISLDAMRETGELVPGRLFRTTYRLLLKPEYAPTFEHDINAKYEHAGLRYRDPSDAIDGLRNLIDMLNTFMSVVG
ncbi:MAG TPA: hypothetical protein VG942_01995, partial [Hyphomonadaceae bacterium]|nr:hypothetical protein [Hyphomonadaceae bacterium]